MRQIVPILLTMILCGCTKEVIVPKIIMTDASGATPIAGKYVAIVQGGQWKVTDVKLGAPCAFYSFDFSVDSAFEDAAKMSLTNLLDSVDFVQAPLAPKQLLEHGYDAQIIVRQGKISGRLRIHPPTMDGDATLAIGVNVVDATGMNYQQELSGSGLAFQAPFWLCNSAGRAEASAFQDALRDAMRALASTIRDQLSKPRNP